VGASRSSSGARCRAEASQTCWRRWPERAGERVGGGQSLEVAGVEGGAQGEVFGGGEGVVLAGGEDAAGGGFGKGGDEAEA
jgi:uncharacterized protein YcfJ